LKHRRLEFRVLGPLEVLQEGRAVEVGGGKQWALFALLLLEANRVVTADRLIDTLWGAAPPATAAKTVQVYVSRLRKQLGSHRIVTHARGYALQLDRSELDLARVEQLLDEARRSEPEPAAERLRTALSLLRGPALADLQFEAFAQPEIARLEELRWTALVLRIDADLSLGRHAELVGELGALVSREPLREGLRAQLMLALYRSGRHADALNAYRQAQRTLADELGLEPSAELRQLEQAILRQDAALDLPGRSSPEATERALLIVPTTPDALDALLSVAAPLAANPPARELLVAAIVERDDVAGATSRLAERRRRLMDSGVTTRAAAFASAFPGREIVRLAEREHVDLLLAGLAGPFTADTLVALEQAPCDVALLVEAGGALREGPMLVPFGGTWHDWAALELVAWVAQATDAPLQLIGAEQQGQDASRLLADASLILQRTAGVFAQPLLAHPGREVLRGPAQDAGLLVVGLSDRWRQEGLGRLRGALVEAPPAPTVLVRRGPRPGGLAPPETITRFGWSLTAA